MNATTQVKKAPLIIALMTVLFLAAMEITITALATPAITRDLAGFDLMSLMFSSFLVASAITTPIFGRLADRFGRKPVLIVGIAIFLFGCLLCGFAQSMPMLIAFRGVQGLGAGSIFTLTFTIVGDSFPVQSRAAIMGLLNTVWGVAGIAGPILGGLLIEGLSWHWIFFVNIPIGLISIALVAISLTEHHNLPKGERSKDRWKGVFTRLSIVVNIISFIICMVLIGFDVYLVFFLQNVLGYSPMIAGLSFMPISLSWLLVSFISGKLLLKFDSKYVVLGFGIIHIICIALFISMDFNTSLLTAIIFIFLSGFGIGGLMTTTTVIIQDSVGYDKRGTAMGINGFLRTVGQAVGVSILGAALNMQLTSFLDNRGITGVDVSTIYQNEGSTPILESTLLVEATDSSLNLIFLIMFGLAALSLLVALLMPRFQLKEKAHLK